MKNPIESQMMKLDYPGAPPDKSTGTEIFMSWFPVDVAAPAVVHEAMQSGRRNYKPLKGREHACSLVHDDVSHKDYAICFKETGEGLYAELPRDF